MRLHQISASPRSPVQIIDQLAVKDYTEPLKRVSPSSVLPLPASLRLTRRRRTSSGFPSDVSVPYLRVTQPSGSDSWLDAPLAALLAKARTIIPGFFFSTSPNAATVNHGEDEDEQTKKEVDELPSLSYWALLKRAKSWLNDETDLQALIQRTKKREAEVAEMEKELSRRRGDEASRSRGASSSRVHGGAGESD